MIPRIATGGCSFKGASRYYLHDKKAESRNRVAWTQTENLLTDDPDKAWKVMAFTALEAERLKEASGQKRTGRKLTKPVFSYSLSWHPEQDPTKEQMLEAARESLRALRLHDHEALIISHRDEPQRHVHVVVNRVHPLTGLAASLENSKRKLSEFARVHEREEGKIYCKQREENHRRRMKGEQTQYRDPHIAEAWRQADDGRSFAAALKERGYHLARGRKRITVVDPYGHVVNPLRHLEAVRAKQLETRLHDVDVSRLPDVAELSKEIQERHRRAYEASLAHDKEIAEQERRRHLRQQEERETVSTRHRTKIEKETAKLTKHYQLKEQRQTVARLAKKLRQPPLWRRLLGLARKDRAKLEALQRGLENAQGRIEERIGKLEQDRDRELSRLQHRHDAESTHESEQSIGRRPKDYLDERKREELLARLNQPRSRGRDGPSLSR